MTPLPRSEFAVTETCVYLNHAATGVIPRQTAAALEEFVRAQSRGGVLGTWPYELRVPAFRERVAEFIGARGDEVAFLRSTSEAANVLALGVDWRPGDDVVLCNNEFPANGVPWAALRSKGVVPRFIDATKERMTPDALARAMTNRTRVVTVSWVGFTDGYRHDLAALAEVAHRRGALFFVDAIQGLGIFPMDVRKAGIDALFGSGAKWLLALQGIAYLFVSDAVGERLAVATPGWRSVENMWDFSTRLAPIDYDQPYVRNASKYEGGTLNFIGALSLATSVEFLQKHDGAAIAEHVLALTDRFVEGLNERGATVLSERGPGISSGIVMFTVPSTDPVELGKRLQRARIVTTYRPNGIRVAPHAYNTFEEIDALLEELPAVSSRLP